MGQDFVSNCAMLCSLWYKAGIYVKSLTSDGKMFFARDQIDRSSFDCCTIRAKD